MKLSYIDDEGDEIRVDSQREYELAFQWVLMGRALEIARIPYYYSSSSLKESTQDAGSLTTSSQRQEQPFCLYGDYQSPPPPSRNNRLVL